MYIEALTLNVIVLGPGAFGWFELDEVMRVGPSWWDWCPCKKRCQRAPSPSLPELSPQARKAEVTWAHSEMVVISKWRNNLHNETYPAGTSLPPELGEIIVLLKSHPVCSTSWQAELTEMPGKGGEPRRWVRAPGWGPALPLLTLPLGEPSQLYLLADKVGR